MEGRAEILEIWMKIIYQPERVGVTNDVLKCNGPFMKYSPL